MVVDSISFLIRRIRTERENEMLTILKKNFIWTDKNFWTWSLFYKFPIFKNKFLLISRFTLYADDIQINGVGGYLPK